MKAHMPYEGNYKIVCVWELPVRIFHWLNALVVFVLIVTGYLIGDPLAIQNSAEASFGYWFGTVRFIHFVAAFVFFFNFILRLYWGFVGNKYAKWYNFVPLRKYQWVELWDVIKIDILHLPGKPLRMIGHNALADASYFIMFLAFLMQCLTGFGLYAPMSDSYFHKAFAWIVPLLGGDLLTRQIHHILMWFFIVFTIIHVYLVFFHDFIERRGVTSSMIGGWKFIEEDEMP